MPFLIRSFTLAGYGVFLFASSVSVYLTLFDFGVAPTVTKYVAQHSARQDRGMLQRLLSSAFAYYSLVGVIVALGLLLFARFGIGLLNFGPAESALARELFTVSAWIALFTWPLSIGAPLLGGLERYDLSSAVGSFVVIGNVVVTALVLALHLGPVVLLIAVGAVTIVGGAVNVLVGLRVLEGVRLSPRSVDRATLSTIFTFGGALFIIQLATLAGDQQTDRLVLAGFVGATAVGIYESVAKFSGLMAVLTGLPTATLVPVASRIQAQEQPEALSELFERGTKYTVAFVTPVAAALIVLARPLLLAWLGPRFAAFAPDAQVFLLIWLLYPNIAVALSVFVGTGRLRFLVWFTGAHAVLNLGLTLLLVQRFGVLGVILGTVITEFVLFPIGMAYTLRQFRVSAGEYVRRVVLPSYLLLIVPVLVAWAGVSTGVAKGLLGVGATGLAAVLAYWAAMYVLGLSAAERDEVRGLARRTLGRATR